MRVIVRPFWVASARQRINNRRKYTSLGSSFFSGWRSVPGTMPATSQLALIISMIEMIVLSCSRGVRQRFKSSGYFAMGPSIALLPAPMVTSRHRLPHSISKVKMRTPTRLGNGEGRVSGEAIDTGTRLDPPGYGARHGGRVMRVIGGDPSRLGLAAPPRRTGGGSDGSRRGPYDR